MFVLLATSVSIISDKSMPFDTENGDIAKWLEVTFKLTERSTSVGQELRAASATFLTMSYILLVNPQLLAKIGIPATDVVVGTALSSFVGSILAGYFG